MEYTVELLISDPFCTEKPKLVLVKKEFYDLTDAIVFIAKETKGNCSADIFQLWHNRGDKLIAGCGDGQEFPTSDLLDPVNFDWTQATFEVNKALKNFSENTTPEC